MIEVIKNFILDLLGREFCVLICSMLPIIELRGGIPMGTALGLPWWETFILSVIGNMIPVPFILLLIPKIIDWMSRSKVKFFNKIGGWLQRKADKNAPKIQKYGFWGVCLFVAIPLPVTGAWTGSLVASTIGLKFWKALVSCLFGVLIAGVIVTLISQGALAFLNFLI